VVSILTFGKDGIFDRFFLGILVLTGLCFYRNKDILSVCFILIVLSVSVELLWMISQHPVFRWLTYTMAISVCYWLRHNSLAKFVMMVFICEFGSYIYYVASQRPTIPSSDWFLMACCLSLICRRLFFMRDVYLSFLSKSLADTQLDFNLYRIFSWGIILNGVIVIEYTIRNAIGFQIQFAYDLHPYIIRFLSALLLFHIINFSAENIYKRYA
jgi:hypothetical protein